MVIGHESAGYGTSACCACRMYPVCLGDATYIIKARLTSVDAEYDCPALCWLRSSQGRRLEWYSKACYCMQNSNLP